MRHAVLLAAAPLCALAGCNKPVAEKPLGTEQATTSAAAASSSTRAAPDQGRSLTATSSALHGTVTGFQVRESAMARVVEIQADTLFDFDKAELNAKATVNLEKAARLLTDVPAGTITVTGHTDAKGEEDYNVGLSQRRAETVVAWLKQRPELAKLTFVAVGKGEGEPAVAAPESASDEARAPNRRVEIAIPR